MKELCLVVYDEDKLYIEEFIKFFNKNYKNYFKVIGVTSKENLLILINEGRTIDILVINDELLQNNHEVSMIKLVVTLLERDKNNDIDKKMIFKYQNGHTLFNLITKIYSTFYSKKDFNMDELRTKAITFFSPIGGIGKTTISLLFAIKLTKAGRKVLYLSLEQISSLGVYLDTSDKNNTITDLLYYSSECIEIDNAILQKTIKKDNITSLYYINPVTSTLDFEEVSGKSLIVILESIRKNMDFDYIVIDSGAKMDSLITRLQEYSDKFIGVVDSSLISMTKMSKLLKEFINLDKILILVNKYKLYNREQLGEPFEEVYKKVYSYINYDNELETQNLNLSVLLEAEAINNKVNSFLYKLLREEWKDE